MLGERENFDLLLKQNPRDGMIYFKRGEAYEAIGENALAAADFQRAMAMFPKREWKARAREAAITCEVHDLTGSQETWP